MGATNKTPGYEFPQFVGQDKPTILGDFNGFLLGLDTALTELAHTISETTSSEEFVKLQDNVSALKQKVGEVVLTTKSQSLTGAIAELNELITEGDKVVEKLNNIIGSSTLKTKSTTLSAAINETYDLADNLAFKISNKENTYGNIQIDNYNRAMASQTGKTSIYMASAPKIINEFYVDTLNNEDKETTITLSNSANGQTNHTSLVLVSLHFGSHDQYIIETSTLLNTEFVNCSNGSCPFRIYWGTTECSYMWFTDNDKKQLLVHVKGGYSITFKQIEF